MSHKQTIPSSKPQISVPPTRELIGFHGHVREAETWVYQNRKDSTGTFRQQVLHEVQRFSPEGYLLQLTDSQSVQKILSEVSHSYSGSELMSSDFIRPFMKDIHVEYRYDDAGLLVKEIATSEKSVVEYTCIHKYDSQLNRLSRECTNPSGRTLEMEICNYDKSGRLVNRIQNAGENGTYVMGKSYDWQEELIFAGERGYFGYGGL